MAVKKKRTAKQLAATKKLVALNKKRRAKPKRKVKAKTKTKPKKKTGRVSQITKRKPTARLKARRAKPKKKGYFANPIDYCCVYEKDSGIKFYFDGSELDTEKKNAARFASKAHAEKIAKRLRAISKMPIKVERVTPK